jgi:hypothetical protein
MGGISGNGGDNGGIAWEFFCHFDASDHESTPKVADFMDNVSKKFQNDHNIAYDFCNTMEPCRKPDGYCYSQEEQNQMYSQKPSTAPYIYQWKVQEAFNPNRLRSSYYPTVDPEYLGKNKG